MYRTNWSGAACTLSTSAGELAIATRWRVLFADDDESLACQARITSSLPLPRVSHAASCLGKIRQNSLATTVRVGWHGEREAARGGRRGEWLQCWEYSFLAAGYLPRPSSL